MATFVASVRLRNMEAPQSENILGQNIRRLRGYVPLAALADKANHLLPDLPPFELTAYYISDLEQGRNKKPNTLAVLRLAAALDTTAEALYSVASSPVETSSGAPVAAA